MTLTSLGAKLAVLALGVLLALYALCLQGSP